MYYYVLNWIYVHFAGTPFVQPRLATINRLGREVLGMETGGTAISHMDVLLFFYGKVTPLVIYYLGEKML